MDYYFAPMEGITGYVYRRVYAECFCPCDKYFTPFIAPGAKRIFKTKELKDILPEHNEELFVVPQILSNHAPEFIETARALREYGYEEVNLNLGCPSGTVTAKGKGSGFLQYPKQLEEFLDTIFQELDMKISVKTRIGVEDEEEFDLLLDLYNRYPMEELIIHPRLKKDHYRGKPNWEAFQKAVEKSKNPICYNGNLFTAKDLEAFCGRFPSVDRLMLGRGLVGNPALLSEWKGKGALDKEKFRDFHEKLTSAYEKELSGKKDVLFRMKELWFYMSHMFSEPDKYMKKIKKTDQFEIYLDTVDALIREQEILPGAGFSFA